MGAFIVPLYLILEYIEGPTLEKRIVEGPMSFEDAVSMTLKLVETVNYCHECNIGHRDIKPDNIVLRGGASDAPVLIDFGQTFNTEDDQETAPGRTTTNEQMGNRFLLLPEHRVPGGPKRDLRSDLTACCGILFYALTAEWPTMLRDAGGLAPYERDTVQPIFERLAGRRVTLLRVLGRGFRNRIGDRWQTASELTAALQAVVAPDAPGSTSIETVPQILAALARTREEAERKIAARDEVAEQAADVVATFFEPVRKELLDQLERRRAEGVPLDLAPSWNGNDTSLPMRDLVRRAASKPGRVAPGVFYVRC